MRDVVVAPDRLLAAGLAHALDHRIVVQRVGQDQAVRQQLGDGRDAGLVRHVARGEDQRGLLAVQVGELGLELDQRMIGAGDVARAARAGAHARRGLDHRADHLGVLAHAEIVVGAPDHDVALALRRMPVGVREPAGDALQVGEHPVAPLVPQRLQGTREKFVIIHWVGSRSRPTLEIFLFDCRDHIREWNRGGFAFDQQGVRDIADAPGRWKVSGFAISNCGASARDSPGLARGHSGQDDHPVG